MQFKKHNNSHPRTKIALREWVLKQVSRIHVLEVYGGGGLMYDKVWGKSVENYSHSEGDALEWLSLQKKFTETIITTR